MAFICLRISHLGGTFERVFSRRSAPLAIMARMDQAVLDELDSLGWWYQHFQLPNGLWTGDGREPAYLPERRWEMIEPYLPADLTGKTVLDLGGNAGYFSIRMKLRGAARCVLVDPFGQFLSQAEFAARQFAVELDPSARMLTRTALRRRSVSIMCFSSACSIT